MGHSFRRHLLLMLGMNHFVNIKLITFGKINLFYLLCHKCQHISVGAARQFHPFDKGQKRNIICLMAKALGQIQHCLTAGGPAACKGPQPNF